MKPSKLYYASVGQSCLFLFHPDAERNDRQYDAHMIVVPLPQEVQCADYSRGVELSKERTDESVYPVRVLML